MNPADIHGKKLIAVAGKDVFGKQFISVVNKEIAKDNLMAIGININEEDFNFFISNLPQSKVEITIFMPEYQQVAAQHFGLQGVLLATVKKENGLEALTADEPTPIDDVKLLQIIQTLKDEYGI